MRLVFTFSKNKPFSHAEYYEQDFFLLYLTSFLKGISVSFLHVNFKNIKPIKISLNSFIRRQFECLKYRALVLFAET